MTSLVVQIQKPSLSSSATGWLIKSFNFLIEAIWTASKITRISHDQ
ncbi:hypothetical protein AKJ16_DCAP13213 [Drosera capensis]